MNKLAGVARGFYVVAVVPMLVVPMLVVLALGALPARAGDDAVQPSPRTAVEIGAASVVLVAANDKIYAFVDRLEDNAPVADSALSVDLADGTRLKLTRVSDGLFVAPFSRNGRMQDAFLVSLVSQDGTGDATAEIAYGDVQAPEVPAFRLDLRTNGAIALVSGAIGAALSASVMLLTLGRRRRGPVSAPAGSAILL